MTISPEELRRKEAAFEERTKKKLEEEAARQPERNAGAPPKDIAEAFHRLRVFLEARKKAIDAEFVAGDGKPTSLSLDYEEAIKIAGMGEVTATRDLRRLTEGSTQLWTLLQTIAPWNPDEKKDFFDDVMHGLKRLQNQQVQLRGLVTHIATSVGAWFAYNHHKLPEKLRGPATALTKGIHADIVGTLNGFLEATDVEATVISETPVEVTPRVDNPSTDSKGE